RGLQDAEAHAEAQRAVVPRGGQAQRRGLERRCAERLTSRRNGTALHQRLVRRVRSFESKIVRHTTPVRSLPVDAIPWFAAAYSVDLKLQRDARARIVPRTVFRPKPEFTIVNRAFMKRAVCPWQLKNSYVKNQNLRNSHSVDCSHGSMTGSTRRER